MKTIEIPQIKVSKTTINGYLTAGSIIFGGVAATPEMPPTFRLAAGALASLCTIWMVRVGHLMKDADSTLAQLPSGAVEEVAAHSVPDNPQAIPVKVETSITEVGPAGELGGNKP